eukprot:gene32632-17645_t
MGKYWQNNTPQKALRTTASTHRRPPAYQWQVLATHSTATENKTSHTANQRQQYHGKYCNTYTLNSTENKSIPRTCYRQQYHGKYCNTLNSTENKSIPRTCYPAQIQGSTSKPPSTALETKIAIPRASTHASNTMQYHGKYCNTLNSTENKSIPRTCYRQQYHGKYCNTLNSTENKSIPRNLPTAITYHGSKLDTTLNSTENKSIPRTCYRQQYHGKYCNTLNSTENKSIPRTCYRQQYHGKYCNTLNSTENKSIPAHVHRQHTMARTAGHTPQQQLRTAHPSTC